MCFAEVGGDVVYASAFLLFPPDNQAVKGDFAEVRIREYGQSGGSGGDDGMRDPEFVQILII